MSGVNKVILVGHVGKDPEVRYLEGGVAVAKFSLATSETYKTKDNKKVEQTEWHNITMWRHLAELAEKYIRKGSFIYIEGKIRTRTYGEENNKKYFTEIVADTMNFMGGPKVDTGSNNSEAVPEIVTNEAPAGDLPF